jgi:hypothetical protein
MGIVEETVRGTDPGSGYGFLSIESALMPQFNPTDEARNEFRGQDSGLGNTSESVVRRESQWTETLVMAYRASDEINLLLKHFFGFAGTRAVVDTTAYKGIFYPLTQPYGEGQNLGTKAIGLIPNYDVQGTTKSKYFGGAIVTACRISGEGSGDIMIEFDLKGAGGFIGAETTALASPTFSAVSPFVAKDILLYIGTGIARTGTAPDFTDIAEGSMVQFCPDSFSVSMTNGLDDKVIFCGTEGPTKTFRSEQFTVECNFPTDLEDPPTGFSSHDAYESLFAGPDTTSILMVGASDELAGSVSEKYGFVLDLAGLLNKTAAGEYSAEGQAPTIDLTYSSLYDTTAEYPVSMTTIDQDAAV